MSTFAPTFRRFMLLALAVSMLAFTGPSKVSAEAWGDTGSGVGGSTGSTPVSVPTTCVKGELWERNAAGTPTQKLLSAPSSYCVLNLCATGRSTCRTTTARIYCPQFEEVWRFYGTRSNPLQAMTVSHINHARDCEAAALFTVFSPHPNDAGAATAPSSANPFQARVTSTRRMYGNAAVTMAEKVYYTQPSAQYPSGTYTTTPPFITSGSCTTLLSSDTPFAAMDSWAKSEINTMISRFTPGYSAATARAMSNVNAALGWDDGLTCSSALEFSRAASAIDPMLGGNEGDTPVYGTCWIPVVRLARPTVDANGNAGPPEFSTAYAYRYDDDRYPANYSSAPAAHHASWRAAIQYEVASRQAPSGMPNTVYDASLGYNVYETKNGSTWVSPGEPYSPVNMVSRSVNRAQAAVAASLHARCEDGPLSNNRTTECIDSTSPDCMPPPEGECTTDCTPPPPADENGCTSGCGPGPGGSGGSATIIYRLDVPNSLIVGGAAASKFSAQEVKAYAYGFKCTGCAPANGDIIYAGVDNVYLDIQVAPPTGFDAFKLSRPVDATPMDRGCTQISLRSASATERCSSTVLLDLYRATAPTRTSGSDPATKFTISLCGTGPCDPNNLTAGEYTYVYRDKSQNLCTGPNNQCLKPSASLATCRTAPASNTNCWWSPPDSYRYPTLSRSIPIKVLVYNTPGYRRVLSGTAGSGS